MAGSNEQDKPKRMSRPFGGNTEKTDAIQTNSKTIPTREQVSTKVAENIQQKREYEKLAKQYPDAAKAGMDLEGLRNLDKSTTEVSFNGKLYRGKNYRDTTPQISKDTKTEAQHQQAQIDAQQQLAKSEEAKNIQQAVELVTNPRSPFFWVPWLKSATTVGADEWTQRNFGSTITPYTIDAASSILGDALMASGVSNLPSYIGSYAGTIGGGYIGDKYNHPILGELIGGIAGGVGTHEFSNLAKQAIGTYQYYNNLRKFGKVFKNSVETKQFGEPLQVEHVTPAENGNPNTPFYVWSNNDVGGHLSLINSKTTQNIMANSNTPMVVREGYLPYISDIEQIPYLGADSKLNWTKAFYPELYENGVRPRPWNYPVELDNENMQSAIQLSDDSPVQFYYNGIEAPGEKSIAIFDSNEAVLSKNIYNKPITNYDTMSSFGVYKTPEGMYLTPENGNIEWPELYRKFGRVKNIGNDNTQAVLPGDGIYIIHNNKDGTYNLLKKDLADNNSNVFPILENVSKEDIEKTMIQFRENFDAKENKYLNQALKDLNLQSKKWDNNSYYFDEALNKIKETSPEMSKLIREAVEYDRNEILLSDEYKERIKSIFKYTFPDSTDDKAEQFYTYLVNQLKDVKYTPMVYFDNPKNLGRSAHLYDPDTNIYNPIGFNLLSNMTEQEVESALGHEFGHVFHRNSSLLKQLTSEFYTKEGTPENFLLDNIDTSTKYVKYLCDHDEFRQRIYQGVRIMIENGKTPEEVLSDPVFNRTELTKYFKKEYLLKALKLLASVFGITTGIEQINNYQDEYTASIS